MSVTEEIKTRLDIVNYIQQYVPLKKAGRYYKAPCPFHSERTPSFMVNPDTQTWRCYGACAEGGDIFNFAMKKHGWAFGEALRELGQQAGVEVRRQTPEQQAQVEKLDQLRGVLKIAAETYHDYLFNDEDKGAVATLHYTRTDRGFSDDTIHRFQIGYAPPGWRNMLDYLTELGYDEDLVVQAGLASRSEKGRVYDRFRHRLIIPIRDDRGRVIGFGARALDPDDDPKYLNSPQSLVFDKSRTLFALDLAKTDIRQQETAVIVEGYMDAIQAHQAGFTNVVAQMGTAMTELQVRRIAPRWAKKIIMALDADAAGQNATRRSLEVARQTLQADFTGRLSVDIRVLQIPGAKDPDDLLRESPEQWQALVDAAVPVADYVIDTEVAALPNDVAVVTVQEREAIARRILPLLLASESNLYKKDNIQKLALRLRIAERELLDWAQQQQGIQQARPPRSGRPEGVASAPEPPPLDFDAVEPPPDAADDRPPGSRVSTAPGASTVRERPGRQIEASCLRTLFHNPNLLYQVNRKFRELAGERADLLRGPLAELGVDDFDHSDYRVLFQMFIGALEQDGMEPLDFIAEQLEPALWRELETLLADDLERARHHLNHRFDPDLSAVRKQAVRKQIDKLMLVVEPENQITLEALRLRRRRLRREGEDLYFLQHDSQTAGDEASLQTYLTQVHTSNQAKRLIDTELGRDQGSGSKLLGSKPRLGL